MLNISLICVGKMKERHYISAFEEYEKRLNAFCRMELIEIPEAKLPENPSEKEIAAALEKEGREILKRIQSGTKLIALCIEGEMLSSTDLAGTLQSMAVSGTSRVAFVIGGSFGLHGEVKKAAAMRLSMSKMTFPHHLVRVMAAEQIYRAFTIIEGNKYHK